MQTKFKLLLASLISIPTVAAVAVSCNSTKTDKPTTPVDGQNPSNPEQPKPSLSVQPLSVSVSLDNTKETLTNYVESLDQNNTKEVEFDLTLDDDGNVFVKKGTVKEFVFRFDRTKHDLYKNETDANNKRLRTKKIRCRFNKKDKKVTLRFWDKLHNKGGEQVFLFGEETTTTPKQPTTPPNNPGTQNPPVEPTNPQPNNLNPGNENPNPQPDPETQPEPVNPEEPEGYIINSEKRTVYVRPPFGAQFKLKNDNTYFTTIFAHLDSPGVAKNAKDEQSINTDYFNIKTANGKPKSAGAQEVSEFLGLPNVARHFESISQDNSFVIFGGDTNISADFFSIQNLYPESYKFTITNLGEADDKTHYTSLGRTNGVYSQPYDKMFFKNKNKQYLETLTQVNTPELAFKFDIWSSFRNNVLAPEDMNLNYYTSNKPKEPIRARLSDHAPVWTDVKVKNNVTLPHSNHSIDLHRKDANALRIAHWNVLNYGTSDDYETFLSTRDFKYIAISKIIKALGFDIVGLTEINYDRADKVQAILDELNKDGSNWKMIAQDREEAVYPQDSKWAKYDSQKEQVVIIYDANIFDPTSFKNNKIGDSFKAEIPLI
ncbi:Vmc-like lipoprotein signal peptide domain-containing protein [Mycoplasma sp. 1232]|uniref:Vmc-like lipoprotein signal peptide domain-containing protein n=1 Tax=Mycoplasma sp. 1232 TaxID=3108527 RepID=UPI002B25B7A5|nr:hypothetical protein [Mycoplasma sp. 1232]MEA4333480.1 hypothetical protein [Mycoplasma sp. 1232]